MCMPALLVRCCVWDESFAASRRVMHPPVSCAVSGQNVTVEVPGLVQNQQYTFVVEVKAPSNYTAVYTGTRGTPVYTRGACCPGFRVHPWPRRVYALLGTVFVAS